MAQCIFCNLNIAIKNSHVIPRFFFKWLKENSFTGYMRGQHYNYNRVQDGIKEELLCNNCELEFSKYENKFKSNIFDKIVSKDNNFIKLTNDDRKFIYSLIWRVIASFYYFRRNHLLLFEKNEIDKVPHFLNMIRSAYDNCTADNIRTHLLPLRQDIYIEGSSIWHKALYFQRAIGCACYPWENERYFLICIKLPMFIIICEIRNNENELWNEYQIEKNETINLFISNNVPEYIYWLLKIEYDNYTKAIGTMSDKDNEKIIKMIKNGGINDKSIDLMRDMLMQMLNK